MVSRCWRKGEKGCDYLMGVRFPFGIVEMFRNYTECEYIK